MLTDQSIMPYGKYKGKKLIDIPDTYLVWLYDQGVTGPLKIYIEQSVPIIQAQVRARERNQKKPS